MVPENILFKTLLATNDLCPDIFLSGFGIHISCSLFSLFTSSEMFLVSWRKTYTYQIVWNFSFFAGKWVACIFYHQDLELSCDGIWFCHSHGFVYPFLLFLLGPLFCFPFGSLSCPGWSQLILSTWSFICRWSSFVYYTDQMNCHQIVYACTYR